MMGTIKKPFMPLLCLFMLSLVLIFCWNRLFVKKLYAAPSLSKIAAHWSPYIYQGTKNNYDFITNFNFDGNWNGKDN